ncbi:MAG: hypothetical protein OPY03_05850 [Nitrosopumilus sp.]|nr:hypothetical protein [Nitrosopumilus sp.]
MNHKDFLKQYQVTYYEMILAFVVISAVAIGIGWIDAIIFDTYIKIGMVNGVGSEHGELYQGIMQGLLLWIALGLGGVRVVYGILAGAKIVPILFLTGALWFFSTIIFHNFAFTDYFYYKLRGLEMPDTLDWLNDIGIFNIIRDGDVTKSDVHLVMGIGAGIVLLMWVLAVHHYKKGALKFLE